MGMGMEMGRHHGLHPYSQQNQGPVPEGQMGKKQPFAQMVPGTQVLFLHQPIWGWLALGAPLRTAGLCMTQWSWVLPQVVGRTMQ